MKDRAAEAIASFKETSSGLDLSIVFLVLIFLILFGLAIFVVRYFFKKDLDKRKFFKLAFSKGLSKEEASFLYFITSKLKKDPLLILRFKPAFEKLIYQYVNSVEKYNDEFIGKIREKLKFNRVSKFAPLMTTKDIEPLQKARIVILQNMLSLDALLHDKDEKYMHWHLSDIDKVHPEFIDADVEATFIRQDDGIYKFESKVDDVYMENGKVLLKVPHVLEMKRIQRRKYPRVPVSILASLSYLKKYENNLEKTLSLEGEIVNISAGGIKFCTSNKEALNDLKNSEDLSIKFKLENISISGKVEIVREVEEGDMVCFGMKFIDLSSKYKELIQDFVRKKQIEMKNLFD